MPIWWRRARFSSCRAARERKIEDRVARSVVREMSIGRENYERSIIPLPSDISRFSRGTIAEDGIAVAKQVRRELVKGKGLPQLLSRPFRCRMGGHIAVNNTTTVMGQYQKHVKDLETEGGHRKEVDGDQLGDVILQKGAPGLRGRLVAAHHIFADAGLADVDDQLEQLPVNAGCTPTGVLAA